MTDNELIERLMKTEGRTLSKGDEQLLDERLARTEFLSGAVKAMSEEDVSLAWRSSLNERLLGVSRESQKRRRNAWIWRPALGLSLAGALAVAFFVRVPQSNGPIALQPSIETAMVNAHKESVQATLVAGRGLSVIESKPTTSAPSSYVPWEESDLGDL